MNYILKRKHDTIWWWVKFSLFAILMSMIFVFYLAVYLWKK